MTVEEHLSHGLGGALAVFIVPESWLSNSERLFMACLIVACSTTTSLLVKAFWKKVGL